MSHIVLCDDHPVFVDALGAVLGRQGFVVDAVVNDVARVVPAVARHRPALCVIDRNFGPDDGLALISPILTASPGTKVLMLTADRDEGTARQAISAGATGFLCKTAGLRAVVDALWAALAGTAAVEVGARPGRRVSAADADAHRLAGYLTNRERECLALIVEGHNSSAIAERLGVSVTTVRTHVQSVLTKLGVHSRLEAASFAVRHSLLTRSA